MTILSCRPAKSASVIVGRSRAGMIAIGELMLMLSFVVTLLWLGSQVILISEEQFSELETSHPACSDHAVYGLGLDRSGTKLWARRSNDEIYFLDPRSGLIESRQSFVGIESYAKAQSGDGETMILCGVDNVIALLRHCDDTLIWRHVPKRQLIADTAVSCDGRIAIAATCDGHIYGWCRRSNTMIEFSYDLPGSKSIAQIGVSSSGRYMHVMHVDGTITVHDSESGHVESGELTLGTANVAFAWGCDDRILGVSDSSGMIRLFDPIRMTCLWTMKMSKSYDSCFPIGLAISPNGRWLAACCANSYEIEVFKIGTSHAEHQLKGHWGVVKSLQFSRDSTVLYSGSYDGTIREWSGKTWSESRLIK